MGKCKNKFLYFKDKTKPEVKINKYNSFITVLR